MGANFRCLLFGFLLLVVSSAAAWGVDLRHETYSSVKYLDVIASPVGTELHLDIRGQEVSATLKDYEGEAIPVKVPLTGKLVRDKLTLTGEGRRGRVEISGTMQARVFRGVIKRWFGPEEHRQEVVLRRRIRDL